MSFESITDQRLDELRLLAKRVTNPQSKRRTKGRHEQVNYLAVNSDAPTTDEATIRFNIYVRQSLKDPEAFSCGISWSSPNGEVLTLARYNGSNHVHDPARYECHVHRTSEKAIREGRKPEHYAETSDQYRTLDGALHCLMTRLQCGRSDDCCGIP